MSRSNRESGSEGHVSERESVAYVIVIRKSGAYCFLQ